MSPRWFSLSKEFRAPKSSLTKKNKQGCNYSAHAVLAGIKQGHRELTRQLEQSTAPQAGLGHLDP